MQNINRVLPHQIGLTKLFLAQCLEFLGNHEPEGELLERDKFVAIVVRPAPSSKCVPDTTAIERGGNNLKGF
jgi:hypothetical protein